LMRSANGDDKDVYSMHLEQIDQNQRHNNSKLKSSGRFDALEDEVDRILKQSDIETSGV